MGGRAEGGGRPVPLAGTGTHEAAVEPASRSTFRPSVLPSDRPSVLPSDYAHVAAAMALVKAFRTHGHLAARLDPLGSEPPGDPAPAPEPPALSPAALARIPAS